MENTNAFDAKKDFQKLFVELSDYGHYGFFQDPEQSRHPYIYWAPDPTIIITQNTYTKKPSYQITIHCPPSFYSLMTSTYSRGLRNARKIHETVQECCRIKMEEKLKASQKELLEYQEFEFKMSRRVTLGDLAKEYCKILYPREMSLFIDDFLNGKISSFSNVSGRRRELSLALGESRDLSFQMRLWFDDIAKRTGALVASYAFEAMDTFIDWAEKLHSKDYHNPFGKFFPGLTNRYPERGEKADITALLSGTWIYFMIPKGSLCDSHEKEYPFEWGIGRVSRCHLSDNFGHHWGPWRVKRQERFYDSRTFEFDIEFMPFGVKEGQLSISSLMSQTTIPAFWITHEIEIKEFEEPFSTTSLSKLRWNKELSIKFPVIRWRSIDWKTWTPDDLKRGKPYEDIPSFPLFLILQRLYSQISYSEFLPLNNLSFPGENYKKDLLRIKHTKHDLECFSNIRAYIQKRLDDRRAFAEAEDNKVYESVPCFTPAPDPNMTVQNNTRPVPDIQIIRKQIDEDGYPDTAKAYGISISELRRWSKNYPGRGILSRG